MSVLHLFDLYLPHTMNWAWRLMRAVTGVEQWVAAPWMLSNTYYGADFRFFTRPIQRLPGCLPKAESQMEWVSSQIIRAEKRWPLYKKWLASQLEQKRPDVLHAHFAPVGCHYLDMARQLGVPLVCSFYGFDFERVPFEKRVYQRRYQQLFEGAAAVTTTGDRTPELLLKQGCPAEKIRPVPMSIDTTVFPRSAPTKAAGQLRLVQVATITDKKGHLDTLAAFQIARQACPNLQLVIAGERQDKNLYQRIRDFVVSNGLEQSVRLHDFVPQEKLPAFLSQFDVFIHPSRTAANRDCEGAPAVILEAMCTGLPVLSTFHSDIPQQVLQGQTGFLVPERKPVELAACIERFYHMDSMEFAQMSLAARSHVERNFDLSIGSQKLMDLYKSIIDQSTAQS